MYIGERGTSERRHCAIVVEQRTVHRQNVTDRFDFLFPIEKKWCGINFTLEENHLYDIS